MSFALIALVCAVALLGPLLSLPRWLHLPVVVGELAVGVALGSTGFGVLDHTDPTFAFLAQIGFVLVMFVAGSHVPIREPALREGLATGAARATGVAVLAVPAGLLIAAAFGTGHGLLYAVLIASSSAALIMPVLGGAPMSRPGLMSMLSQIAVADVACIVLLPLAIDPPMAARSALGVLVVLAGAVVLWWLLRWLQDSGRRKRVHVVSEDRALAIELRSVLAMTFALAALAVAFSVSTMLAGFALGIAVAAVGEPRRVAKQLFALTEGFFSPLFFVWLGASLDLRRLVTHPSGLALGVVLGLAAVAVHAAMALTGQALPVAALTSAQLGVPVAAVTLGTTTGVLGPGEGSPLLLGALVTIAVTVAVSDRVTAVARRTTEA